MIIDGVISKFFSPPSMFAQHKIKKKSENNKKKLMSAAPSWPFINAVRLQINLIPSQSRRVWTPLLHSLCLDKMFCPCWRGPPTPPPTPTLSLHSNMSRKCHV